VICLPDKLVARAYLFQKFRHRIVGQERLALHFVKCLRCLQEALLENLAVHGQGMMRTVEVVVCRAKLDEAAHGATDETCVNGVTIAFSSDEVKDSKNERALQGHEQIVPPRHERQPVDFIDVLVALFPFSRHPVTIEIPENVIDHFA